MLGLHTLAEVEPPLYRAERIAATARAAGMSDAQLQAELMRPGLSVLSYNIMHAALASRQPRLPESESAGGHFSNYEPLDRA